MSDEFPELTRLPGDDERLGKCQIVNARESSGVMVTRFHESPDSVVVAQPMGETPQEGWLYVELCPDSARSIADELYMRAGEAERYADGNV